jgi:hypothetical protein
MQRDELFAAELYEHLTDGALEYLETLISTDRSKITNRRWGEVAAFATQLDATQRDALRDLMVEMTVGAAASAFAVIQGVTMLESFDNDIRLLHGDEDLGRDIMTNFLAVDERARPWVVG